MKKKGLIISTIVMVVVLIASLTTATYAWFTTDSKATIGSISINTASASDVQIGLRASGATGEHLWDQAPTAAQFKNGAVGFDELAVTNGTAALGASITSSLSLANLSKAIGTALESGSDPNYTYTVDATTFDLDTTGHVLVAANGSLTVPDNASAKRAHANMYTDGTQKQGDYVDWVIGFMPTKNNVDTFTFNVTINPGEKPTLGLLAALHLRFSWDGETYYDVDLYGSNNHQDTLVGSVVTPTYQGGPSSDSFNDINNGTGTIALNATSVVTATNKTLGTANETAGLIAGINDATPINAGALNYAITVGTLNTALAQNKINQMHFQLYYAGYDVDCVNGGLGADATIYFTISNTTFTPAP